MTKFAYLPLRILTRDELYEIHLASLEVLETIGVSVKDDCAFSVFKEAGAPVDVDRRIVKIPERLVKEAVVKTPERLTLCGRDNKYDLSVGGKKVYFRTSGGTTHVYDLETDEHRLALLKDLADGVRLIDALPNVHTCIDPVTPSQIRPELIPHHVALTMFENTRKHIHPLTYDGESARDVIEMAAMISGGMNELVKKPIISGVVQPVSPLQLEKRQTEILLEFSKNKLPFMFCSQPMAGSSSPVTLAGSLVINNAENLAGLVLTQLISPGNPFMYGTVSSSLDMTTGSFASGAIERSLLCVGVAQLAQYYGIPSNVGGGVSDSKVLDEQAAYDKTMTLLPPALAGANIISGLGLLESYYTFSLAQLIIDNEIAGIILRALRGIEVSEDTLAVDLIRNVGPGGHFLAEKHTLEHLRKELFIPDITDRKSRGDWKKAGGKDIVEVAKQKAKQILKTHQVEPLDRSVRKQIEETIREKEKKISR